MLDRNILGIAVAIACTFWCASCDAGEIVAAGEEPFPIWEFASHVLDRYGIMYDREIVDWEVPKAESKTSGEPALAKMVVDGHIVASTWDIVRFAGLVGSAVNRRGDVISIKPGLSLWLVDGDQTLHMRLDKLRIAGIFTHDFPFDGSDRVPMRLSLQMSETVDEAVAIMRRLDTNTTAPEVKRRVTKATLGDAFDVYTRTTIDLDLDGTPDVVRFQVASTYLKCPEEESCTPLPLQQIAVRYGTSWYVTAYLAEGMDGPSGH
jgi:hypothetical protein